MQCSNNFKQIGLGIHNYHDVHQAVPPYTIGIHRPSFFVLIMPFIEQTGNYQVFQEFGTHLRVGRNALPTEGSTPYCWWDGFETETSSPNPMADEGRRSMLQGSLSGISVYHCPSRRSGKTQDNGFFHPGPMCDYVVVCVSTPERFAENGANVMGEMAQNLDTEQQIGWQNNRMAGAIRAALTKATTNTSNSGYALWEPRDSFAWVTDGLSNTIFIGEKFVPIEGLANCTSDIRFDCSFLWVEAANRNRQTSIGRVVREHDGDMLRSLDLRTASGSVVTNLGFGSWHTGSAVHFLAGDGSVRTIFPDVSRTLLIEIARVNDNRTPAIP
jgi:hypothetical protein